MTPLWIFSNPPDLSPNHNWAAFGYRVQYLGILVFKQRHKLIKAWFTSFRCLPKGFLVMVIPVVWIFASYLWLDWHLVMKRAQCWLAFRGRCLAKTSFRSSFSTSWSIFGLELRVVLISKQCGGWCLFSAVRLGLTASEIDSHHLAFDQIHHELILMGSLTWLCKFLKPIPQALPKYQESDSSYKCTPY